MPIRAVIFDFGDVLVRSGEGPQLSEWEHRLGLAPRTLSHEIFNSRESHLASLGQLDADALWHAVGLRFGLGVEDLARLRQEFALGDVLDERMVAFARSLRPHYRTAILRNAWLDARTVFTRRFGCDPLVDLIVISAEEGVVKPQPEIYFLVASRLGVPVSECVLIDGSLCNVTGARAAGMLAVLHEGDTPRTVRAVRALLRHSTRHPTGGTSSHL